MFSLLLSSSVPSRSCFYIFFCFLTSSVHEHIQTKRIQCNLPKKKERHMIHTTQHKILNWNLADRKSPQLVFVVLFELSAKVVSTSYLTKNGLIQCLFVLVYNILCAFGHFNAFRCR